MTEHTESINPAAGAPRTGTLRRLAPGGLVVLILAGVWVAIPDRKPNVEDAVALERTPRISPDYSDTILPGNIAPLNFVIQEGGTRFFVRVRCESSKPIEIVSRSPRITISKHRWRELLQANRGKELLFDVYVEVDGGWTRYAPIVNRIALDDIDSHLVYRLIGPVHNRWRSVTVRQRDLTSFRDTAVLSGSTLEDACVNCHSFVGNSPERMLIGVRSDKFGSATLLAEGQTVKKIDTRFGYTAWHPSGRIAAYSINKVNQFFHASGAEIRDVIDMDAALAYYLVEFDNVKMISRASDKDRLEAYPNWSPDGKYLYYCSAPILWEDRETVPPERFAEVKYDLMRIAYDVDKDEWGTPEAVLTAEETGLSILQPRNSPDGRLLLFSMCQYGVFPIYQPSSDLYMMDLANGEYSKLDINSDHSESWHSWSSNSRWIAFSSKRRDGFFTRTYLSHVDALGKAHKPLVVPQRDPEFYDSLLKTFSVPELLTGPVPFKPAALTAAARSKTAITVDAIARPSRPTAESGAWRSAKH